MDCIFCKIINGSIPSYKIYEDEYTYAFLDIAKDSVGHTVVISKEHVSNILDANSETLSHLMNTIAKISNHYVNDCGFDGVNIINNTGSAAEQVIMHIHFHIYPRKDNDGMVISPKLNNFYEDLETTHQKLKF